MVGSEQALSDSQYRQRGALYPTPMQYDPVGDICGVMSKWSSCFPPLPCPLASMPSPTSLRASYYHFFFPGSLLAHGCRIMSTTRSKVAIAF